MARTDSTSTMPIRRWAAVLIAGLFLAPALALGISGFVLFAPTHGPVFPSEEAMARIRDESSRWHDSDWQTDTATWLQKQAMDVVLREDGLPIWSTSDHPELIHGRVVHVEEVSGSQDFILYAPDDRGPPPALDTWWVPTGILAALVAAVLLIAWFLRRSIIEPLTATSQAAALLAEGAFSADIPHSRVREVNDLARSFSAMRDSLQESLTRQAAIEEERRFLISAVAHDLRTPLFAIRGALEGIIHGVATTEEKREQYLQIALKRANDLEKLISDLFAWSRLELAGMDLKRELVRLAEVLERTVDGARPQADARGISILVSGPDIRVEADAALLQRALDNVMDNALVHSPDGSEIDVTTKHDGDGVMITIRDHGPGIPEYDLERIFTPLYRGEESRNRKTGGAGLGLGVARRIVEAHGGTLRARNHPGGGAAFDLRLPVA